MIERYKIRRTVIGELRNTHDYRRALCSASVSPDERARMSAWVRVADELRIELRAEADGDAKVQFAEEMFGLLCRRRPMRDVYASMSMRYHVSEDGLKRWRDAIIFTASILAVRCGAINLSDE